MRNESILRIMCMLMLLISYVQACIMIDRGLKSMINAELIRMIISILRDNYMFAHYHPCASFRSSRIEID